MAENPDVNAWRYCKLCNIRFPSRKLSWSHNQSALHKKNEAKFSKATKEPGEITSAVSQNIANIQATVAAKRNIPAVSVTGNDTPSVIQQHNAQGAGNQGPPSKMLMGGTPLHALQPDCKVCKVGGFRLASVWSMHVEGQQHCSAVLRLFYSMEHTQFFRFYGDVPYAKGREPPDEEYRSDIEKHMASRSGILNNYKCRLCDASTSGLKAWLSHIQGKKHVMNYVQSEEEKGRDQHLKENGDIAVNRGAVMKECREKYRRREEIIKNTEKKHNKINPVQSWRDQLAKISGIEAKPHQQQQQQHELHQQQQQGQPRDHMFPGGNINPYGNQMRPGESGQRPPYPGRDAYGWQPPEQARGQYGDRRSPSRVDDYRSHNRDYSGRSDDRRSPPRKDAFGSQNRDFTGREDFKNRENETRNEYGRQDVGRYERDNPDGNKNLGHINMFDYDHQNTKTSVDVPGSDSKSTSSFWEKRATGQQSSSRTSHDFLQKGAASGKIDMFANSPDKRRSIKERDDPKAVPLTEHQLLLKQLQELKTKNELLEQEKIKMEQEQELKKMQEELKELKRLKEEKQRLREAKEKALAEVEELKKVPALSPSNQTVSSSQYIPGLDLAPPIPSQSRVAIMQTSSATLQPAPSQIQSYQQPIVQPQLGVYSQPPTAAAAATHVGQPAFQPYQTPVQASPYGTVPAVPQAAAYATAPVSQQAYPGLPGAPVVRQSQPGQPMMMQPAGPFSRPPPVATQPIVAPPRAQQVQIPGLDIAATSSAASMPVHLRNTKFDQPPAGVYASTAVAASTGQPQPFQSASVAAPAQQQSDPLMGKVALQLQLLNQAGQSSSAVQPNTGIQPPHSMSQPQVMQPPQAMNPPRPHGNMMGPNPNFNQRPPHPFNQPPPQGPMGPPPPHGYMGPYQPPYNHQPYRPPHPNMNPYRPPPPQQSFMDKVKGHLRSVDVNKQPAFVGPNSDVKQGVKPPPQTRCLTVLTEKNQPATVASSAKSKTETKPVQANKTPFASQYQKAVATTNRPTPVNPLASKIQSINKKLMEETEAKNVKGKTKEVGKDTTNVPFRQNMKRVANATEQGSSEERIDALLKQYRSPSPGKDSPKVPDERIRNQRQDRPSPLSKSPRDSPYGAAKERRREDQNRFEEDKQSQGSHRSHSGDHRENKAGHERSERDRERRSRSKESSKSDYKSQKKEYSSSRDRENEKHSPRRRPEQEKRYTSPQLFPSVSSSAERKPPTNASSSHSSREKKKPTRREDDDLSYRDNIPEIKERRQLEEKLKILEQIKKETGVPMKRGNENRNEGKPQGKRSDFSGSANKGKTLSIPKDKPFVRTEAVFTKREMKKMKQRDKMASIERGYGKGDVDLRKGMPLGETSKEGDHDYRLMTKDVDQREPSRVADEFEKRRKQQEEERMREEMQHIKRQVNIVPGNESVLGVQHQDVDYRNIIIEVPNKDRDMRVEDEVNIELSGSYDSEFQNSRVYQDEGRPLKDDDLRHGLNKRGFSAERKRSYPSEDDSWQAKRYRDDSPRSDREYKPRSHDLRDRDERERGRYGSPRYSPGRDRKRFAFVHGFNRDEQQAPPLQGEQDPEMAESVHMFATTLQQFLGMVCSPENVSAAASEDELSPAAREMMREVCALTGVSDSTIVSHAVRVLASLDPVIVQTLGVLPPVAMQQFMSGNLDAVHSEETLNAFKEAITNGKLDINALQESIVNYTPRAKRSGQVPVRAADDRLPSHERFEPRNEPAYKRPNRGGFQHRGRGGRGHRRPYGKPYNRP